MINFFIIKKVYQKGGEAERYGYNFNKETGVPIDGQVSRSTYNLLQRQWYIDTKTACTPNTGSGFANIWDCNEVWSDVFVLAASGNLGISNSLGFTNTAKDTYLGAVSAFFSFSYFK